MGDGMGEPWTLRTHIKLVTGANAAWLRSMRHLKPDS